MKQKTALITGITGQDGSYLAELLLGKNYRVVGLVSSATNPMGTDYIETIKDRVILVEGDLQIGASLETLIAEYTPDEIYNLAGVTFVPTSWQRPSLTLDVNAVGVARLLESIMRLNPPTRLFQASSAKIFGNPAEAPQTETTPVAPTDPYGVSKAAAHFLVQAFRTKGVFGVNGILYNHESERRGIDFVTRKITRAAAHIKMGQLHEFSLGNLDAQIDWGYAPDYVEGMWRMLQHDKPDDYILATGQLHSIRELCEIAFSKVGLDYRDHLRQDPDLIRSDSTTPLVGDASKMRAILDWHPKTPFAEMIERMVDYDYRQVTTPKE